MDSGDQTREARIPALSILCDLEPVNLSVLQFLHLLHGDNESIS